jgi:hypothetical protein
MQSVLGVPVEFRVCETPIFVSHEMRRQLEDAAIAITLQSARPTTLAHTTRLIDEEVRVRQESDRPLFSVVDFAITMSDDGTFVPRLIELQGFPSLFGYQLLYTSQMRAVYGLDDSTPFLSDLSYDSYSALLRECIIGGHDADNVALVELDPLRQKTRPDFIALEKMIGLKTVDIRDVYRDGRQLVHTDARGQKHVLRRIFNRAIVDELRDHHVHLNFRWDDDLDVEWAGNPNWYFLMSKSSMPYLDHPTVPRSMFLNEIDELPADLDRYVLKPLYAFAGKGVIVGPTHHDVAVIPAADRHLWILQERVTYARCIPTPHGDNAVEIRVMCLWPDRFSEPLPVMSLARTGRGAYMGARYNTEPWTGSSGCLFV